VIRAVRKIGQDVDGVSKLLRGELVRIAANLRAPFHAFAGIGIVRVHHVHVVAAAEELRVHDETQQPVLRQRLVYLVDRDGHLAAAARRIDAHDPLADALGDPEETVRSPGDFPWILETGRDDARSEGFGRVRRYRARVHISPRLRCRDDALHGADAQRDNNASNERSNDGCAKHDGCESTPPACVTESPSRGVRIGNR
jgi:hypothetical protein